MKKNLLYIHLFKKRNTDLLQEFYMRLMQSLIIVVISIVFIISCKPSVPDSSTDLVSVDGHSVQKDRFVRRYQLSQDFANIDRITPEHVKRFLDKFYVDKLYLIAEAYHEKLYEDSLFQLQFEKKMVNIMTKPNGVLFREVVPSSFNITEAELHELYSKSDVQIKLAHILLSSKTVADSLYDELTKGADFADLAKRHSLDIRSSDEGGLLRGNFTYGMAEKSFDDAAFSLKEGEYSKPVKSSYGYHIIKVLKREKIEPGPFEQMRPHLEKILKNSKRGQFVQAYIDSLFTRFNFTLDEDLVPHILHAYIVKSRVGHLDKKRLPPELHQAAIIKYADKEWSVEKFFYLYNSSVPTEHVPLKSAEDVRNAIRYAVTPYLMYEDARRMKLDEQAEFVREYKIYFEKKLESAARTKWVSSGITMTEDEAKAYFENHRKNWPNQQYEQVRSYVRNRLHNTKVKEKQDVLLRRLKRKYEVVYNDDLIKEVVDELNASKKG